MAVSVSMASNGVLASDLWYKALCASTGGTATSATGVAVKILSDSGSGATSDIISGVNWVVSQYQASGRPSIGVMALGGGASAALDAAVSAAVNVGVSIVVTAGNHSFCFLE